MSGKISGPDYSSLNIRGSRSPWWATLPVSQRVLLLKKVALMLSSVSDLQQFLHQQMTLSPEFAQSKVSSSVKQTVDLLSLSLGKAVRRYVGPWVGDIVGKETKTASSKSGRRTRTTRKGTRT